MSRPQHQADLIEGRVPLNAMFAVLNMPSREMNEYSDDPSDGRAEASERHGHSHGTTVAGVRLHRHLEGSQINSTVT